MLNRQIMALILSDIELIVKTSMLAVGLKGSNILEELKVIADDNGDDLIFGIVLNDYVQWIENGRRSGKMPPLEPIEKWCKRHGINASPSVLFAIRRMIGNEGIRPRPFLDNVFQEIGKKWNGEWSELLFADITKDLYKWFN